MSKSRRRMNILIVVDNLHRTARIHEALKRSGARCRLHAVRTASTMLNLVRSRKLSDQAGGSLLILFDFSEPESKYLKILNQINMSPLQSDLPMVVLTSRDTQHLIEKTYPTPDCVIFSPIKFHSFLRSMNQCEAGRFVSAVLAIAKLGFVLVRVPESFLTVMPDSQVA